MTKCTWIPFVAEQFGHYGGILGQNFIYKKKKKWVVFNIKSLLVPVGEIDLEMLSELRLKHPEVTVDNEVVEPSAQQLHNYRGTAYTYLAYHKFILCLCIHMRPPKYVNI